MAKNKIITKIIGNILFAGLLVGMLPVSTPLKAQSLPKLSKAQVNTEIKSIKKTVRQLKIANVVIPGLIIAAGVTIALVALGLMLAYKKFTVRKFKKMQDAAYSIKGYLFHAPHVEKGVIARLLKAQAGKTKAKGYFIISALVAIAATIAAPVAAALSFIGIGGGTLVEAFDRAERLERMEREHPGTLTHKQKIEISRLKNLYKGPIIRGIIKYFRMKNALKMAANIAIQKNRMLVVIVGGGTKKKAQKRIAEYIKAKWKTITLQRSVEETKKQSTKAKLKWNISYKIAQSKLKKAQKKVSKLEKKYPPLKTLQKTVQEYEKKISEILEGVPEAPLKPKGPMLRIVPL